MTLNGMWKLYYYKHGDIDIKEPSALENGGIKVIDAVVPGNVELDLSRAGILPDDLFKGENIELAEEYESYDWWYEKAFVPEELPEGKKAVLNFHAVDCYAIYFLNGEQIGTSDNMFIEHKFDVTDKLLYGKENIISVYIRSALSVIAETETDVSTSFYSWISTNMLDCNTRKAAHSFGWDIMPRALSAGIWRDVTLDYEDIYGFNYIYLYTENVSESSASVKMCYDSRLPLDKAFKKLTFKITGKCGDSEFETETWGKGKSGKAFPFKVNGIKPWWPRGYGEPNMYDISIKAYLPDGELVLEDNVRFGFRTVALNNSETVGENGGEFRFIVNNVPIQILGTNWVPLDAYHSRDKERYPKAFELVRDININMIRCWGGNVYEDTEFFDFCDDNGILLWQDFGFACNFYPQSDEFLKRVEAEAESVVKKLRHHTSLALWNGDNEVDMMIAQTGHKPSFNRITREVLPNVLKRHDPARLYLMSSPYISDEAMDKFKVRFFDHKTADAHLWGPRDYFKSRYYTDDRSPFLSEIGYHGCPSVESINKFIDPEFVWHYKNNKQWNLHSTDQFDRDSRVMLMDDQVKQLFGEVPDGLSDFVAASQISQAEAYKFYIERVRLGMGYFGGIIWWNLIDGWPQMSDAVVDYYYGKKLAYYYIKRSSRPFIIAVDEIKTGGYPVVCCNATRKTIKGKVTVTDLETGNVLINGQSFNASPNGNTRINVIDLPYAAKGMLLIKWETEEGTYFNTYLYGYPAFSLSDYKRLYDKVLEEEEKYYKI